MPKSEKRQRNFYVRARCTEKERADIEAAAEAEGLSIGAYIRAQIIGKAGERYQRRPPADRQELTRLLGELGKVGGNLNQIARRINSGDKPPDASIEKALEAVTETMEVIRKAIQK